MADKVPEFKPDYDAHAHLVHSALDQLVAAMRGMTATMPGFGGAAAALARAGHLLSTARSLIEPPAPEPKAEEEAKEEAGTKRVPAKVA